MNQIYDSQAKSAASKVRKSFQTTDLAMTMALLVIVFSVAGGIVSEAFQDPKLSTAQLDVERLALTLSEPQDSSRMPAAVNEKSASEISQDPWGQPYHYKILKAENGITKVVVVSSGPNKKLESNLDQFENTRLFSGDDVGFVYDGSNKRSE